ncbi:MAG: Response regulator MprA [Planctomycetes bacterium ADurb.Bin401]|nr:MAG: Response regulator MprA [Planctomycetes bacterium ADurb.Bin401]
MKKKILIVDDDTDFIGQLEILLSNAEYDIDKAYSKAEAEKYLDNNNKPDLAIVDLMMENTDSGFALCYHIKKKYNNLPVIMVTAVTNETGFQFDAATPEDKAWIKADAFLAKPIRFEQLKREMNRLLGN